MLSSFNFVERDREVRDHMVKPTGFRAGNRSPNPPLSKSPSTSLNQGGGKNSNASIRTNTGANAFNGQAKNLSKPSTPPTKPRQALASGGGNPKLSQNKSANSLNLSKGLQSSGIPLPNLIQERNRLLKELP